MSFPLYLNKTEIAALLNVDVNTITKWVTGGLNFPVEGSGKAVKYPVNQCVEWYAAHQAKKALEKKNTSGTIDWDEKLKQIKFEDAEYEFALKRRTLVTIEDANAEADRYHSYVRAKVEAVPGLWSTQLLGLKSRLVMQEKLEELTERLMYDIANPVFEEDEQPAESEEVKEESTDEGA